MCVTRSRYCPKLPTCFEPASTTTVKPLGGLRKYTSVSVTNEANARGQDTVKITAESMISHSPLPSTLALMHVQWSRRGIDLAWSDYADSAFTPLERLLIFAPTKDTDRFCVGIRE